MTTSPRCPHCFHPQAEHDNYGCMHMGRSACKCPRVFEEETA